jgi:hypothetical protein
MHVALQLFVSLFALSSTLPSPRERAPLLEHYQKSTVLRVSYGEAPGEVGLVTDVLDEPSRGPESFAITADGIVIVDSVNGRLAEFGSTGKFLRVTETGMVTDVIASPHGALYALDPRNEEVVEAGPTAGNRRELRAAAVDAEGIEDFVRVDSERGLLALPGQMERFAIRMTDDHGATVTDHLRKREFRIATAERFGSGRIIGVDDTDAVYIAVEQLLVDDTVTKEVRKYAGSRLVARIELELGYEAHPTRELVVDGDGSIYHLRPLRNLIVVEKWAKGN